MAAGFRVGAGFVLWELALAECTTKGELLVRVVEDVTGNGEALTTVAVAPEAGAGGGVGGA